MYLHPKITSIRWCWDV